MSLAGRAAAGPSRRRSLPPGAEVHLLGLYSVWLLLSLTLSQWDDVFFNVMAVLAVPCTQRSFSAGLTQACMFVCFCPRAQSKKRVMATVAATVGDVTLGAEILLPVPQAVGTRKQQPVQLHLLSQPSAGP